ncbi:MAG: L-glutamate gamma-semialdehyde dehydrogenase [Planctomycetota bacterium]|jgi:RHH-type proline utilization regulon transcriptional repressor/proline dehydrogenase/delta 1-pyrroline-5-carboxylate dehydrogenase
MGRDQLEARILARGKELFAVLGAETPSVFNKNWWTGKVMDWSMGHEDFKVQLFRFIDVLPYLRTEEMLSDHIREYFARGESVPAVLKLGAKGAGVGGRLGMKVLGKTIRKNLENMARQFIIGGTIPETVKNLEKFRRRGFAFTLDVLGEATVSEAEADLYAENYMRLLGGLERAQSHWPPLGAGDSTLDWGHSPKINLSIKPSALYSQINPADFEGSVGHILDRLRPVYRKVVELKGFMCIDIEMRKHKEITFELYRRLRSESEFRDYPHLGLAMQVYLRSCDRDIDLMLEWARRQRLPISIRLVKGAYWDYEIVAARQNGWPVPVYTDKAETDAAFERRAEKILRRHDFCYLACASHNVRSVCSVLELARVLQVPEDRYEFQVLYGMAEPFRNALLKTTGRVRLYCPQGELLPGMAYLIRRLLENTSNESFLRQTYVEGCELEQLLKAPKLSVGELDAKITKEWADAPESQLELGEFVNEPFADFSIPEVRDGFTAAVADVKAKLGRTYSLFIGGKEITTDALVASVNPARPREVIGRVCQAGTKEIEDAIGAAQDAFKTWRDAPPRERAGYLVKAAEIARKRIYELAAWQVLEAGKQLKQAYNDVAEAIDFMEYYAREMMRLAKPRYLGHAPGEVNDYFYQPIGVAAVIAPWNFPLAIGCGMSAAALVAGNCLLYKPSNQTPIVGHTLLEILQEAELPPGVFNYTPGSGAVMGDFLIDHPQVSLIAFTGSMEVGLRIIERAARTPEIQPSVKKVVAEMGGKNAVIVDDDADLDEVVPHVIDSAFAYQGQKCSACSRVIVLDTIYDRFVDRLIGAARSVRIGPPEDPANLMGPVIDQSAQKNIRQYIEIARKEGTVIFSSVVPDDGYYVPITIVGGITPEKRLAQEEVFGPVLAVMRVEDFDQAIAWANSTRFALTGGVFSRNPRHLEQCRKEFRVGNLYVNRGCTGAIVERQPFGGFRMSGVGSKAGGPDYLLQFMDPRTVTENTMRRGFVPIRSEDEWVE